MTDEEFEEIDVSVKQILDDLGLTKEDLDAATKWDSWSAGQQILYLYNRDPHLQSVLDAAGYEKGQALTDLQITVTQEEIDAAVARVIATIDLPEHQFGQDGAADALEEEFVEIEGEETFVEDIDGLVFDDELDEVEDINWDDEVENLVDAGMDRDLAVSITAFLSDSSFMAEAFGDEDDVEAAYDRFVDATGEADAFDLEFDKKGRIAKSESVKIETFEDLMSVLEVDPSMFEKFEQDFAVFDAAQSDDEIEDLIAEADVEEALADEDPDSTDDRVTEIEQDVKQSEFVRLATLRIVSDNTTAEEERV